MFCIALEDFSTIIGVTRLSRNTLYREEELVPLISWLLRKLLVLEIVGSSVARSEGKCKGGLLHLVPN